MPFSASSRFACQTHAVCALKCIPSTSLSTYRTAGIIAYNVTFRNPLVKKSETKLFYFSMVYNYTYSKHNETLLDGLSAQRQNQSHFCDITIKTRDDLQNEVIIFGHKCVLATTSDHLNSIINMEENQQHNLEYDMSTIADAGTVSCPS